MSTPAGSSKGSTPVESRPSSPDNMDKVDMTDLENLQSDEQRRVLDTVSKVQGCGLQGILSFPQLVACGDQSSGKSSVLEALTGVPFPRSTGLCTRFATEINLRRGPVETLTIKVIPDGSRPASEREKINAFKETITDLNDLPRVMELAKRQMGIIQDSTSAIKSCSFARDVLSLIIEGPTRPQLTLVDIPGLIAAPTGDITEEDIALVSAMTKSYIEDPRTICLAVVPGSSDCATQGILARVKKVDANGRRTIGILTKPDRIEKNAEEQYIKLAKNGDVRFILGWHVLKNRTAEEEHFTLSERNTAELAWFRTSKFNVLPKEHLGIDQLRKRLSHVLFEHVKGELPKLRTELDVSLVQSRKQLADLGVGRSSPAECRSYLTKFSREYSDTCKAAINGHYENRYFLVDIDRTFDIASASTIRRTRAVVQSLNSTFAIEMGAKGHKYAVNLEDEPVMAEDCQDELPEEDGEEEEPQARRKEHTNVGSELEPEIMGRKEALEWVRQALVRNRGKELLGNFNPLLIGELLREQTGKWEQMAVSHIEQVSSVCSRFLQLLLRDKCLEDIADRLWSIHIEEALDARLEEAYKELKKIITEVESYPINYNHYYTETIANRRQARLKAEVARCVEIATTKTSYQAKSGPFELANVNVASVVSLLSGKHDANMESYSCQEALECLAAIYKVTQKVFIANVTTQVIERHIVKNLDEIFEPVFVNGMSDQAVEAIASEPLETVRKREYLTDQIEKLEAGQKIFRKIMGGSSR